MALSSLQLEAFLAVAQTLNFTRAAELVHVTQSALSQRIMNLERELQTSLFIRDRAGLRLTEKALELVRYCRCKNSLEEEFLSGLQGAELSGIIRIGGFSSVMSSVILPSLAALLRENPGVKIRMITDELANLPTALRRGEIDYLILDHVEPRDDLERILLGSEQNVLVQMRKYKGPEIYLDHDENDNVTREYLKMVGRKRETIERRYLGSVHGLLEGARRGLGRAVIPKHLLKDEKELEVIDPRTVLEIPVFLCFYRQPYYSQLHLRTVQAIATNVRAILSGR